MRISMLLLMAALLTGCASRLATVHVPAAPPSVRQAVPDSLFDVSLEAIGPIDPAGTPTRPREVLRLADTIDAPSRQFVRASFGREGVTLTLPTAQYQFAAPAWGETLHVLPDTASGGVRGEVTGQPEERQLKAKVIEAPRTWHERLWERVRSWLAGVGLVAILAVFAAAASRMGLVQIPFLR